MSEDEADDAERDARFLLAYLSNRDELCPRCQYNLRNLVGDRCPECGEQLVVRVNLAEPKIGAMIAGLVGLSAGAGFSGLLSIYFSIEELKGRGFPNFSAFFWYAGIPFVIEGLLTVLWIVKWRAIRRMPTVWRTLLVIGGWAATMVNITVFSWQLY